MTERKVLIVSYFFPPAGIVGVHRTLRFIKWLPEFGWQPIVLTATNAKVSAIDDSLMAKVPESVPVRHCRSFEWPNNGTSVDGRHVENKRSLAARLIRKVPTDLWQYFAVPDDKRGWVPFAKQAGARLIREYKPDAIYVTGKPFSSYLVGEALSRKFDLPWIMDLRDLWTLNRRDRPKNWFHGLMNPRMERRLIKSATMVVANTPGNRREFVERFKDCTPDKVTAITNGYDGDDFAGLSREKYGKFSIGYSGTFYFGKLQAADGSRFDTYSPRYLFQAVQELFAEIPAMRGNTQLLFTGPGCSKIGGLVETYGLSAQVRLLGFIDYRDSLEVLTRSHILPLMLSSGADSASWIPSKLFQYLGAGTPILGLVPEGDVANIIRETQGGDVVVPDDVQQIKAFIRHHYEKWSTRESAYVPNWPLIEKYEARRLSGCLGDCLNQITGHTSTRNTSAGAETCLH